MSATAVTATDLDEAGALGPVVIGGADRFERGAVVVGGSDRDVFSVEFVEELVARASVAVEMLQMLDASSLSTEALSALAVGTERVRRQVAAVGVETAGHVDRTNRFRRDGTLTARAWLKHRLRLSGAEAHRRVQVARMHSLPPLWANGAAAGMVGVAQTEVMAQVAANPRLDAVVLQRGAWELFLDAIDLPFQEFEANARRWEKLADPDGAADQAERNRLHRDAEIRPQRDGSWRLTASFDDIGGAEFADIFGHYLQAEWDADWVVIDLGRKQRLFRGSARDAVMLLATECAWVGCDAKAEWCQADHSIAWKAHGATVPWNGGPLWCRHNGLKEQGYRVSRDADGTWHTFAPDGAEIL
jgi:Domain of unknown function (DUF222)